MKKIIIALLLFLISTPFLSFGINNDGAGKITFLKGTCYVKGLNDEYKRALVDQLVYTSDTIKTLENSEIEITLSDQNKIIITEDSELSIHHSTIREKKYTNIGLQFGSITLFINKLMPDNDLFEVNTITATAGIRGTEFDVTTREDGAVLINVNQGQVETEYQNKRHIITGGKSSVYYLTKGREDFNRRIEYREW